MFPLTCIEYFWPILMWCLCNLMWLWLLEGWVDRPLSILSEFDQYISGRLSPTFLLLIPKNWSLLCILGSNDLCSIIFHEVNYLIGFCNDHCQTYWRIFGRGVKSLITKGRDRGFCTIVWANIQSFFVCFIGRGCRLRICD